MAEHDLVGELDAFLAGHEAELVEFRRDLHAHPEVGYAEHRTTRQIALRLESAGLRPSLLPKGTGLIVDVGGGAGDEATVALRADIDALPIVDEKNVTYRSLNPGACHACGHDVHTSILLGTGLFLARAAASGALPGKVRLIFQPAEEVPGGALDVLAAGGISSVDRIFALHCDPKLDVGKIGTRIGAITAACDKIKIELTGPGGHTARPHLTADLVFALGKIITELPAALSRRIDPRSALSLVWGRVSAGTVANAIPDIGVAEGTVRCLDDSAWHAAPDMLKAMIESVASDYGVTPDLSYVRSVPPAVNDAASTAMIAAAADRVLGPDAITQAPQSLGGEDFAWYLESIPGSLFRLGTRRPGSVDEFDIHQPMFDVDERCIGIGVRVMAATAMTALGAGAGQGLAGAAVVGSLLADRNGGPAGPAGNGRAQVGEEVGAEVAGSVGGPALTGPLLAQGGSRPPGAGRPPGSPPPAEAHILGGTITWAPSAPAPTPEQPPSCPHSASRPGPARQEPARQEPGRQEPGRQEPGRQEPGRQEPGSRVPRAAGPRTAISSTAWSPPCSCGGDGRSWPSSASATWSSRAATTSR